MIKLKEKYGKEVVSAMQEKFGYNNVMACPRIKAVFINSGMGRLVTGKTSDEQKKTIDIILEDLSLISGQMPVLINSKKSISAFKLREGMPVGVKVVLRGKKMYDFLERLINIALPRVRDFRGIDAKSFGKKGNITIGLKEHTVFPEILPEKTRIIFGFEITVVTTAETKEEGAELLRLMGFPLKK